VTARLQIRQGEQQQQQHQKSAGTPERLPNNAEKTNREQEKWFSNGQNGQILLKWSATHKRCILNLESKLMYVNEMPAATNTASSSLSRLVDVNRRDLLD
jgi:hypothetical protein